jgi:hypothetical protein
MPHAHQATRVLSAPPPHFSNKADYAPAESLRITLFTSDGACNRITVQGHDGIGEAVQRAYAVSSAWRLTVSLLGGDEIDAAASF